MSDPNASKNPQGLPRCEPVELRTLFLFEKLTDEQLGVLCREGHVEVIQPGRVYAEGEPAEPAVRGETAETAEQDDVHRQIAIRARGDRNTCRQF